MKVYIIHGWDGSPNEPMLRWLASSLEARDYEVTVPAMPDPGNPTIEAWTQKLARVIVPNEDTILIGHSIGCQAILRYLQTLPPTKKVKGAVFIAPWMKLDEKTIEEEGEEIKDVAKPWMETPIAFEKVRGMIGKIIAIFSDNDPYVPIDQKAIFEKDLGATIIVEKKKGHFTAADGITALPSALNAAVGL
jgi:predicted alpha/beta hydrolase family esterase